MCQMKSGIILKDKVFIPDYDHHTQMLEELNFEDTRHNAESLFVRAELIPPNKDFFVPIDKWSFIVDQDITPDWFVPEYEEQRMRQAVKAWADKRIYIGIDNLTLSDGSCYYLKDCKNVILSGNANVGLLESSQVNVMWGNSQVNEMRGNSQVNEMGRNAQVNEMWESSQVNVMWGNSKVNVMRRNAQVNEMRENAQVNEMRGNSKVNEMWGNSKVNEMWENAQVNEMWGNSKVNEMWENAQVNEMWGNSKVNEMWENAQVNVMRENAQVNISPDKYFAKSNTDITKFILSDNSTVKDGRTKTIYHTGSWKLEIKEG